MIVIFFCDNVICYVSPSGVWPVVIMRSVAVSASLLTTLLGLGDATPLLNRKIPLAPQTCFCPAMCHHTSLSFARAEEVGALGWRWPTFETCERLHFFVSLRPLVPQSVITAMQKPTSTTHCGPASPCARREYDTFSDRPLRR